MLRFFTGRCLAIEPDPNLEMGSMVISYKELIIFVFVKPVSL